MQAKTLGQITLADPAQTIALGQSLAPVLRAGDTVLLEGPIGAGKSLLSRAIIQHLMAGEGRHEDVPSPTFTLVQVYELAATEVWHCDLYRLTSVEEALELGLDEAFETAICLVEWPDRLEGAAPDTALWITLSGSDGDEDARVLTLSSNDASWASRLSGLLEGLPA